MATPDFLRPGGRPQSPLTTSWYEFLLQPELLAKHLENSRSIPSAQQIIVMFLEQARAIEMGQDTKVMESVTAEATVANTGDPVNQTTDAKDEKLYLKKKSKALKLLALKVAAFVDWDLKLLMSEIPGPLVLQLLHELLCLCLGRTEENDEVLIESVLHSDISDHAFFALLLYQRWCLQTVFQDCMPRKPAKVNSISVPGLTELVIMMVGINEVKMTQIKKLFGKCKSVLMESLNLNRKASKLSHECMQFNGTALGDFKLDLDKGQSLSINQWGSQVAYDLGCVFFYEADYYKAFDMFNAVQKWSAQLVGEGQFCECNELEAYLKACQSIVNKVKHEDSIINRFNAAILSKDVPAVNKILFENFSRKQLPATACDLAHVLLNDLKDSKALSVPEKDVNQLDCLCCLYSILRGDSYYMKPNPNYSTLWTEILPEALKYVDGSQMVYLKPFINLLTQEDENLCSIPCLQPFINKSAIKNPVHESITTKSESLLVQDVRDLNEPSIALCYDPETIWKYLCAINISSNLKTAVDFWKLPKDLDRLFGALRMDLNTVAAYIFTVKAKELIAIQEHEKALALLTAADNFIKDISMSIAKVIRWEILYCNLTSTKNDKFTQRELDQRVKACLHSLKIESDIYPHESLVMECVSFLLLSKDWEYLSSLHDTRVAFTEYARQLINVCKELPSIEFARAPGKVLWDTTIVIFSVQNAGKRVRLGNQAMLPKDTYKKFLLTIKEPLVVSVLISLLIRVYNMKNTDTEIDRCNTFSAVWPDNLAPNVLSSLDEAFMKETLLELVQHALSINPLESTWLKSYAEILYAAGNLKDALKYYLMAGNIASNNFVLPVPYYVFDNEVYSRLVKCSVHLKNFTHAAILCQFFDEPDYSAAFKYLQEKNCQDGMDIYYDCLWDLSIMEFLIYLHDKRGEIEKKQTMLQFIGSPEVNNHNPPAVLQTVIANKKSKFLQKLVKHHENIF